LYRLCHLLLSRGDMTTNNLVRYARNPIVKNYLAKIADRQKPRNVSKWYYIDTHQLPKYIVDKFEASAYDAGTEEFVESCYEKSDWFFTQVYHSVARMFLGLFMSMTTVNGFLNRGAMFVFSEAQFHSFLNITNDWRAESLLDLGAGDGKVTGHILYHFNKIYATEQSPTMHWRLQEKGFEMLEIEKWSQKKDYSLITVLNLMDRIDQPIKLLHELHSAVKLGEGLILLAIVLPYNPCYEKGSSFTDPLQRLPITGKTIEEQIKSLHDDVFIPNGFDVVKFTRLPYLCEGDLHNDFFLLTDILFLLKTIDVSTDDFSSSTCPANIVNVNV